MEHGHIVVLALFGLEETVTGSFQSVDLEQKSFDFFHLFSGYLLGIGNLRQHPKSIQLITDGTINKYN